MKITAKLKVVLNCHTSSFASRPVILKLCTDCPQSNIQNNPFEALCLTLVNGGKTKRCRLIDLIKMCEDVYRYSEEQKMTEFGRSSISDALVNFSSNSVLPIALAAIVICRINS